MRALSFRQPWAELVLQGRKTMDLRTYNTHYRGRILIHAAQTIEEAACRAHGLDPAALPTGGFVGTVEVVDVESLSEERYAQTRSRHLAGRNYQAGMFGWQLADPQRWAEMVPGPGRTNLFVADVAEGSAGVQKGQAEAASKRHTEPAQPELFAEQVPPPPALPPVIEHQPEHQPEQENVTPERPFALWVQPITGATTDFALALRQRVVERPNAEPHILTVVTIAGDNLRAVADHVLEALRRADYKVTDLGPTRRKPFLLPEETGVRLGLVFLTVKPLTKLLRVEAISNGIRQMPSEEAYYWYSKCTAAETAERAQKALRVLLADE